MLLARTVDKIVPILLLCLNEDIVKETKEAELHELQKVQKRNSCSEPNLLPGFVFHGAFRPSV